MALIGVINALARAAQTFSERLAQSPRFTLTGAHKKTKEQRPDPVGSSKCAPDRVR